MRPQLHPSMGEIVLCARIARQLAYRESMRPFSLGNTPAHNASNAAWHLPPDYPGMLRFALHSLSVYLDIGFTSSQWLANVLEAAHFGSSFRRCFFFDYKENRRPYPRVTNRGVQTSRRKRSLLSQEECDNA